MEQAWGAKHVGLPEKASPREIAAELDVSGDSENWSGGDTNTGPPRGARQHDGQGAWSGAISGADGSGDGGADPSGRGGDATALGSRLGSPTDRQVARLLTRDGAQVPAAGRLAALRQAQPQLRAGRAPGVAAGAVSGPPGQCRRGAPGAGQREGHPGEPANSGAQRGAVATRATQRGPGHSPV
jgi:hypothetical protein